MKDIVTYINEVSKGLVQRAYNKASGAQKNRLKKLYKEIYGDDVTKGDISKIDFDINTNGILDDDDLKNEFKRWSQDVLDKINHIEIEYEDEGTGASYGNNFEAKWRINIDGSEYYEEYSYDSDGNVKIKECYPEYEHESPDIWEFIAMLYKEKYS